MYTEMLVTLLTSLCISLPFISLLFVHSTQTSMVLLLFWSCGNYLVLKFVFRNLGVLKLWQLKMFYGRFVFLFISHYLVMYNVIVVSIFTGYVSTNLIILRCKIKSVFFEIGEIEIAPNSDTSGMKFRIIVPIYGQIIFISVLKRMSASSFKNTKLHTFCIIKLKISWIVQCCCLK